MLHLTSSHCRHVQGTAAGADLQSVLDFCSPASIEQLVTYSQPGGGDATRGGQSIYGLTQHPGASSVEDRAQPVRPRALLVGRVSQYMPSGPMQATVMLLLQASSLCREQCGRRSSAASCGMLRAGCWSRQRQRTSRRRTGRCRACGGLHSRCCCDWCDFSIKCGGHR